MSFLLTISIGLPIAVLAYTYMLYPLLLIVLRAYRTRNLSGKLSDPTVSITVPAYNEEASIGATLENLLQVDYPRRLVQIAVVSDASTDRTDQIVESFADRGVQLIRMPERKGKTAAENAVAVLLTGDIVINTDASVRIDRAAVKALVRRFDDPSVGVASGRDISVASIEQDVNASESTYVDYEMWVRRLETRVYGIVGASGCLYAIRRDLHDRFIPETLSRDFAAALVARERGYRTVSADDAICYVPRTRTLRTEYRRKVRTTTRGIQTLLRYKRLLNPLRFGVFAWMLASHKLMRWLTPCVGLAAIASLLLLSLDQDWYYYFVAALGTATALATVGWLWPESRPAPALLAIPAYVAAGSIATVHAWLNLLSGTRNSTWEPTRREAPHSGSAPALSAAGDPPKS